MNAQIKELMRMAYKTGYANGIEDGDGIFCRDACEEGWQQYLEEAELAEKTGLAPTPEGGGK